MKKAKKEFSNLRYLLFSGIFLSGIGGYPPPFLIENHPAQKPLAEMEPQPPLNEKSAKLFRKKSFPKRTKNDGFVLNKIKNGPKGPYNPPKRARNVWKKGKKWSFWT